MASVKKGQFISKVEWAKHLRKWGKKGFWHQERVQLKTFLKRLKENL